MTVAHLALIHPLSRVDWCHLCKQQMSDGCVFLHHAIGDVVPMLICVLSMEEQSDLGAGGVHFHTRAEVAAGRSRRCDELLQE